MMHLFGDKLPVTLRGRAVTGPARRSDVTKEDL